MASFEDTLPRSNPSPLLTLNREVKLDHKRTMDLIIISQNPQLQSLWDLIEMEIIVARDIAMAIDPAKPAEQNAKMTIAHAMSALYFSVRDRISFITSEHLNEVKQLDMKRKLESPEEIERMVMEQLTNELNRM